MARRVILFAPRRKMKTVRFKQIVARCGRPHIHLTWVKPEKDRELMALLKAGKIMTVHQPPRGATKDYGTVGLFREGRSQLLVFPKSLRRFAERRVVGIDYELLETEQPVPAEKAPRKISPPKNPAKIRKERAAPPIKPVPVKPATIAATAKTIAPAVPAPIAREIKRALRALKSGHTALARAQLEKLVTGA